MGFSVFSTGLAEASCHLAQVISALCFPLPPWHVPAVSLLYPINLVTRESIVGQMPGRQGYFLKLSPHLYPRLLASVISPAHVIHSRSMTRGGSEALAHCSSGGGTRKYGRVSIPGLQEEWGERCGTFRSSEGPCSAITEWVEPGKGCGRGNAGWDRGRKVCWEGESFLTQL